MADATAALDELLLATLRGWEGAAHGSDASRPPARTSHLSTTAERLVTNASPRIARARARGPRRPCSRGPERGARGVRRRRCPRWVMIRGRSCSEPATGSSSTSPASPADGRPAAVGCPSCRLEVAGTRAQPRPATCSRSRPASTAWSWARTRSSTSSANACPTATSRRPSSARSTSARPGPRSTALDPVLERLFQVALHLGRETRSWREVPPRSLADVVVDRILPITGPLAGRRVLVVGAGRMARLVVLSGARHGARVLVANRSRGSCRRACPGGGRRCRAVRARCRPARRGRRDPGDRRGAGRCRPAARDAAARRADPGGRPVLAAGGEPGAAGAAA